MSWALVAVLAALSLALRGSGFVVPSQWSLPPAVDRRLQLLALAMLGGVIGLSSLSTDGEVAVDARLVGLVVALAGTWLRRSVLTTFVAAVAATALVRLVS